ncbi:MAG: zinc-dependent alcohol dehydrogenase family protein [Planctomycetota bacterium]|nr:zinc-dependent alcohol dehydrogenase family protein [Planctomycetota bacterium]
MKQVVIRKFGGVEMLDVDELPTPEPGQGEIRVRLTSVGMNHADLMARRGEYRLLSGAPPFTPGLEGGGIIDAIGPSVLDRDVGQRVVLGPEAPRASAGAARIGGTYRSHYICRAEQAWPAPDAIPDNQLGALWLTYLTAWGCLVWKQQIRAGDFVGLPAASSGVALAAAQIVRSLGAVAVGLSTRQEKIDRLKALPESAFDHYVLTHDGPTLRPWHQDIKKITSGHGIDVYFDPVASGEYLSTEIRSLAQGGAIHVYGLLGEPGPIDIHPLIRKSGTIRGWMLGELTSPGPASFGPGCRHILEGFAQGVYRQHVDQAFPLADVRRAHEVMEAGKHVGKLVLVP